ncbi:MAG: phosphate signaling complex protein PhoU [Verrucomicrobiota bacterium]
MKRYFHEELETVRSHIMLMGEKAIENVEDAMRALLDSDRRLAEQVIERDEEIDKIEMQIDDEVARYVSLRAPVARDLRLLFVAVKSSHDLERVGDEATSIANRMNKALATGHALETLGDIPRMCELAISMLQDALGCFIQEDEEKAFGICMRDKEVDQLNRKNFAHFVENMKTDPEKAEIHTELVFISKSFERIADHAKNIAEEVYYLLTAESLKAVIKNAN